MTTTFKKDPDAVLDYEFDWSAWLTDISDSISGTPVWMLSPGLTKVSQSNTSSVAAAFISGGVLGETETVTCRITTAGGRTDDRTVNLKIVSR